MSFLTGRVTYLRFKVPGQSPAMFDESHLEQLREFQAGRQRVASADGIECGWSAGTSVLDTAFSLEKNVFPEHLAFDLRVDTDKLPGDLLKAYYEVELAALSKDNPSGKPSARQKREAKESARDRLEQEAADGRFRKRKCVPVLWDRVTNEVLFGASSLAHVDRFVSLFEQTFGIKLFALTAGVQSQFLAENAHARFLTELATDSAPSLSSFVPGTTPADLAWLPDAESRDFLGNEFLLWLWFQTDVETDTLRLSDDSEVTLMLARKLLVDCPRGQSGTDGFAHEVPSRMPEARRAIQAGKLPRKVGLTLVRHDQQYELTLAAETFGVSAAKLPAADEDLTDPRALLVARLESIREMVATLDLLYARFLAVRLSSGWADELAGMQRWLRRGEANAA